MAEQLAPTLVLVDGVGPHPLLLAEQIRRCGVPAEGGAHLAECHLEGDPPPTLVILVGAPTRPVADYALWHRAGVPQLPVALGPGAAVVGPLLVPGLSACAACVARSPDPVALDPAPKEPAAGLDEGPTLMQVVAGVVVLAVDDALSAAYRLAGVSTQVRLRPPQLRHRYWPPHPRCPCGSRPGAIKPGASARMAG